MKSRNENTLLYSKRINLKAEQSKKAAIITAEGDSKAAELIAKALSEVGDGINFLKTVTKNKYWMI